ncbi:MAG TPA: DHA2 family efflux MFS transporter permease subunit [Rhizomicrobium sp.]|jgi:DHA2 family multidrug resistance protein|nr:DHA2 family efflux MFS transporter permease subunit [Rhizomicrobium sp.]
MSDGAETNAAAGQSQYLQGGALFGVIVLLALANFMAVLDLTIVNVAVPHIAGALAVSPNQGTWVITSYAVAEAITVPLTGWLAARFGAVRVFVTAAAFFGLFSMLCGFAPSLSMLVVFRVLQGLSGGPLMPMSQTLLMRITPPKRVQMALGLQTMTTIIAPILGPVLGGIITDSVGWPWAFYINVPISIFVALAVWRQLRSRETDTVRQRIDYTGLGLLVLWVGAFQIMLDNGQDDDWFSSPFILTLAIVAAIGLVAFLIWELTDEHPIVDLSVFRNRTFSVMAVAMAFAFGSFMSTIVLIPLWLQTNMNYTATWAGYVMGFQGVLGVAMAPVAALLVSRTDPRLLMSAGLAFLAAITLWRTTFDQDITYWQLALPQLLTGLGIPLFFIPLLGLSIAAVPPAQTASAAGLVNFIRTMSGAFGTALVTTAWDRSTTSARVDLVGNLHQPQNLLTTMQSHGQSAAQALNSFDALVQSQAVMLATNRMFLVLAAIIATVAAGVWLSPRPKAAVAMGTGGH